MNIDEFKALVIKKAEEFVGKNPSIKTTYRWDQDKYFQFRTERACFRENTHYELRVIPPQNGELAAHFVMEYHFEKKDAVRENFKKIVRGYFSDTSKYFFKEKSEHRIVFVGSLPEGVHWYSMADDADVSGSIDSALNDLAQFVNEDEEKLVEVIHKAEEGILSDEEKFKCLLEYFVAHLEYKQSGIQNTIGYQKYIQPLEGHFVKVGNGDKDWGLQKQIEKWNSYSNGRRITITINGRSGIRFAGKTSYLNWEDTWNNVRAQWDAGNKRITGFYLTNTSEKTQVGENFPYDKLGLYDNSNPNETLKKFFHQFCNLLEGEKKMNKEKEIILKKKNLILQGAPGTGKTYETAALALQILNEDESVFENRAKIMELYRKRVEEGRIAFVTFHQTMDYESFVEGLHAVSIKDENGKVVGGVSYEPRAGIFKEICDRARTKDGDDIETCIEKYIHSINGYGNRKLIPTLTGKSQFYVWWEGGDAVTLKVRSIDCTNSDPEYSPSPLNIQKIKDQAMGMGVENNWPQYAKAFINAVKAEYVVKEKTNEQPYVLIIDEINRGNVSKIFGELITLLEPDKRQGEENEISVKLTYSSDSFTVPSNLYIIGTMNTTDRSVGAIDYAIRRRFAFKTLKAERSVVEGENPNETKDEALKLFDAVKKFLDDNKVDMEIDDMMVGHSYFLAKDMGDLNMKWEYEILPLMQEYYKDGIIKANPLSCSMADFVDSVN